jgi:hypothetical protein
MVYNKKYLLTRGTHNAPLHHVTGATAASDVQRSILQIPIIVLLFLLSNHNDDSPADRVGWKLPGTLGLTNTRPNKDQ